MSGLKRIIMHWSAGTNTVSALDREHYHFIIDGTGQVHAGDHVPEDNISTSGGYAAHTYRCNTGSIGVSLAGMAGAVEVPFNPGIHPINGKQIEALSKLIRLLSEKYGIPIARETVLSHAEVHPTLGIRQNGKWDICWIPGMDRPGDPVAVGDMIRELAAGAEKADTPLATARPTLRRGDRGAIVTVLQESLGGLGLDGVFGPSTEAAVKRFQSASGLIADGVVGPMTWARLT